MLVEPDALDELVDEVDVLVVDPDVCGWEEEVWAWPEEGAPETWKGAKRIGVKDMSI